MLKYDAVNTMVQYPFYTQCLGKFGAVKHIHMYNTLHLCINTRLLNIEELVINCDLCLKGLPRIE